MATDRPVRQRDVADYHGIDDAELTALIKDGTVARYGTGDGKVRSSHVLIARRIENPQTPCPTCGHVPPEET